MNRLPDDINNLTYDIIGTAMDVHRILSPGLLESVYEDAMCVELHMRDLAFERQKQISIDYKGHSVGIMRLDLLVEDSVIVELKAVERLMPIHQAQAMTYLKITGKRLALLINFNVTVLKKGIKRIAL
jgi:GxxExxY protein